jgi:hypothetical protein
MLLNDRLIPGKHPILVGAHLATMVIYAFIIGFAWDPNLPSDLGWEVQPLQVEGILLTVLLMLGLNFAHAMLVGTARPTSEPGDGSHGTRTARKEDWFVDLEGERDLVHHLRDGAYGSPDVLGHGDTPSVAHPSRYRLRPVRRPRTVDALTARIDPAAVQGMGAASAAGVRKTRPSSPPRSISTVSPSLISPASSFTARTSWTSRWINRLSGRAPYCGS